MRVLTILQISRPNGSPHTMLLLKINFKYSHYICFRIPIFELISIKLHLRSKNNFSWKALLSCYPRSLESHCFKPVFLAIYAHQDLCLIPLQILIYFDFHLFSHAFINPILHP